MTISHTESRHCGAIAIEVRGEIFGALPCDGAYLARNRSLLVDPNR